MNENEYWKRIEELKLCYIEQYGFDVVIGLINGLNLETVLELDKIALKEFKKGFEEEQGK